MAHPHLPSSERNLTPEEVEQVDRRTRRSQLLLTIGFQTAIVTILVSLLFVGQDLTYSPGFVRPMFYWACLTGLVSAVCFIRGIQLRRGSKEFLSY